MDITLGNQNAANGCFNFVRGADGDVQFDDTEAHAMMTSVIERKGSYWADRSHGSDLYKLRSLTSRTPSQAVAEALAATQALEDAFLVQLVQAEAAVDKRAHNRLKLDVSWKNGSGERQSLGTVV
jgi:phage gp46-like protein